MTRPGTVTVHDVRLALPEHWWLIPLRPTRARRRSVERLVERQFTGLGDHPQLRSQARRSLLAQAERAATADASVLALSLLRVAGVPVPASLVVHWLDVPVDPIDPAAPGELLTALENRLERPGDATTPSGFALDLARLPPGPVLRRVHEEPAPVDDGDPVPSLVADYWLERPDGAGLVQLAFATPMIDVRDAMLELFDAVTGALHWVTEP